MTSVYDLHEPRGEAVPLLVSVPHTGEEVPPAIASRFASESVRELADTDRHLHRLWNFAPELGATLLCARYSRYVVDLNRPRDAQPLYPGRDETGLVPLSTFAGESIYLPGQEPSTEECAERVRLYWEPYHNRIRAELDRLRSRFGYALLFDAHSIQSRVPRFFEGELPGLMLGDVMGCSAAPTISAAVFDVHRRSGVSCRSNDPFRGGFITRHYGRPEKGYHALQLEMSQRLYMQEERPFAYSERTAGRLLPTLRETLAAYISAAAQL